jgi:DNA helicase-2/ATP-dependent DNA helicase PcrA
VYQKILAHDFNTGCGKKECDWCHFVKSNFKQVGDMMQEEEVE